MSEARAAVSTERARSGGLRAFLAARPTAAVAYGVATVGVAVAFTLRWAIYGSLDNRLPFASFPGCPS